MIPCIYWAVQETPVFENFNISLIKKFYVPDFYLFLLLNIIDLSSCMEFLKWLKENPDAYESRAHACILVNKKEFGCH
jgi:hypothetical protein